MNLQITNIGLAEAQTAEGLGLQVKITRCRFGTAVNYTPAVDGSETDLHGTVVHTAAIASYTKDIASGVLKILVRLYPTDGDFTFGEFALDMEPTPGNFVTFATASLKTALTKYGTPNANVPSSFSFTFVLRLQQGDTTIIVEPGDVNAGGVDYSAQYSELNLRIGSFTGLATMAELISPTPPPTKGVAANHLVSRNAGNRLSLRNDGIYLGDEAPPEVSLIYVDNILGLDPVPAPEYAGDTRWFENTNKWQSLRGGPLNPFKTIGLALKAGPRGITKSVLLKIWQVHRLSERVQTYQSYELGAYGDSPSGCSLDTATGVVTVSFVGLNEDCSVPLLAKDDSPVPGTATLTVDTAPNRMITMTPGVGQTEMVLLYRNATGTLTRAFVTKKKFDGTADTVWRWHETVTPTATNEYNTWALANSQPTIDNLSSPLAGWGTYIGQGPAVTGGVAGFSSNHISFRSAGRMLTRSIGFIASEMHPTLDDSTTFNGNYFSAPLFPEVNGYFVVCYNVSYYGREAAYGDWDMPGLLTMPTAGRVTDCNLTWASASQQYALSLNYIRGRAQTGAKTAKVFDSSNTSFTFTFSGSSDTGYVASSGNPSGYNIKDWLGTVVKSTNPVISMQTNINPADL